MYGRFSFSTNAKCAILLKFTAFAHTNDAHTVCAAVDAAAAAGDGDADADACEL